MIPTASDFQTWRAPRRGTKNPEDQTNLFWFWCVDEGHDANSANHHFQGPSSIKAGPCWSAQRFGQSVSVLPDGTKVSIAGEHEDGYDPDFYIYNDVWVESPEGELTIYGYPEEVFPPTDYHTATLVDEYLILIGSLGYSRQRRDGEVQVLALNTRNWQISRVWTSQSPGWICKHQASYDPKRRRIRISNAQVWSKEKGLRDLLEVWELDLTNRSWHCVEKRDWQQYRLMRVDGQMANLGMIRLKAQMAELGMGMDFSDLKLDQMQEGWDLIRAHQAEIMRSANLDALTNLYQPRLLHEPVEASEADERQRTRLKIDGVMVSFEEQTSGVLVTVEGGLSEQVLTSLLEETCLQLEAVEGAAYQSIKL